MVPTAGLGKGQGTLWTFGLCPNCEETLGRSGPQNLASPSDTHHLVSIIHSVWKTRVWASPSPSAPSLSKLGF